MIKFSHILKTNYHKHKEDKFLTRLIETFASFCWQIFFTKQISHNTKLSKRQYLHLAHKLFHHLICRRRGMNSVASYKRPRCHCCVNPPSFVLCICVSCLSVFASLVCQLFPLQTHLQWRDCKVRRQLI